MKNLSGKLAVITGAGGGIGRAAALWRILRGRSASDGARLTYL